jgi:peptide/nickel transport system substrate-binding protein
MTRRRVVMSPDERPIENLIDDYTSRRIDRRGFLQRAFALGLSASAAGSILAACGGDEAPEAAPPPPATEGETTPATTAAEEPAATTAAEEPPAAPQGGTLRFRIRSDILTLDPAFAPGSSEEETASGIYEGLLAYKPGTWDLANQLAETFEPSADGLQFTFKLKEGIPFHKGYGEVTAEDVKFSFERVAGLTKPKIESPYSGDWVALQEVRVDGKYEGTIILKEQFAPLTRTTIPAYYGGSILSKKAVTELGEEYALNPVGTGPYEFVEWEPKQRVLLKRFAEWGGASSEFASPQWDELEAVPIDEDATADIALESGDLDFGEIALASVDRFEENDDFTVGKYITFDYSWIGMNLRDPALQDVNVRQALRYAIDVPSIIEAAFEGRWDQATGLIPPSMDIGYWEDAPVYERDVAKAQEFMAQAGLDSLDLRLTIEQGGQGTKEVSEIVQANLAEIGINVEVEGLDSSAYFDLSNVEALRNRQLFYINYVSAPDPSWSTVWFITDQIDQWNWMYWSEPAYDRLHEQGLVEQDPERRNEIYIEMQQLWDEAVHTVWVAWPTRYFAVRQGIEATIRPDGRTVPWATRSV